MTPYDDQMYDLTRQFKKLKTRLDDLQYIKSKDASPEEQARLATVEKQLEEVQNQIDRLKSKNKVDQA